MKRAFLFVVILLCSAILVPAKRSVADEPARTVLYCAVVPIMPWPPDENYLYIFNYYQDANDCTDPELTYFIGNFPYPGYCDLPSHPNCIAETVVPSRGGEFTGLRVPVSLDHVHTQPDVAEARTRVFQDYEIRFASFEDANQRTRYVKVFVVMVDGNSPSHAVRIGYFAMETAEIPPEAQTVKVKATPARGDRPPYKAYSCEGMNEGDRTPRFLALLAE